MAWLSSRHSTCYVLSDLKWAQRDDKVELMLGLKEDGFNRLFADGMPLRIDEMLQKDGDYPEDVWLLVDRVRMPESGDMDADTRARLQSSLATAFSKGGGDMAIAERAADCSVSAAVSNLTASFSANPTSIFFSFNSPLGACPVCGGLGKIIGVSEDLVIPDKTKEHI